MSSEGLKSLIVTDPDLVDPEIDTSGLRTQTDTNPRLLASIADFPGISYDPTSFDYLSDLNELFAYGLPMVDTQTTTPDTGTGGGGTGDGGQATVPGVIDTLVTPPDTGVGVNTPEEQRLINEGIGLQIAPGQPVFAPGEMPVTQEEIDAFNAPSLLDSTSTADEIAQDLSNQQAMLNPTGGNIMDEVALTGGIPDTNIIAPSGDIFAEGDPLAEEKIDVVTQEDVDNPTNLLQKLGIPEDFDIKKALIDTGINLVAGVPITLIAKGLEVVLPDDNIAPSTNIARSTGLLQGDNTKTQDIYGINTQTSFDPVKSTTNYNDYNVEQVEKLENRLEELRTDKYKDNFQAYLDNTKRMRQELEDRKEYLDAINKDPLYGGDIDAIPTGDAQIAEETIGTLPEITEARQKQGEQIQEIQQQEVVQSGSNEADRQQRDTGVAKVSENRYETKSGDVYASAAEAAEKSDGGGGGGGCFLEDTPITMADGSTKEVQKVDLGDNVAKGGKVFATGKFLVENLHDYKGIKVSGSHMVNENNIWVRVEDSKHGKPLGNDEHTVYVFGSENRRILINGILFTDYFETTEQQKLIDNEKDFFNNWKTYENKIDQDNINILNAS